MEKKYCYLRVSTIEQNLDRQYEAMKHYDIPAENYFVEKCSGKNTDRPELQKLMTVLEKGDTLYIHDFSRLSRSTSDLLKMTEYFEKNGINLISNKENLDTSTPTGKLMLTMIAAINEFERTNMLSRQLEGIALCKARNGYRKKEIDFELFKELDKEIKDGKISVSTACARMNIKSRKTWYNLRKELAKKSEVCAS